MLYYIIRIIIILIIISIFIIIKLIKNKRKYGVFFVKKVRPKKALHKQKRKKLPYVLCFIAILLFLDIIFYPFEGYFIRFSSLEKSIHYSIYDSYFSSISIVEDDDTVFFMKNNNSNISYHSVTKYNNDYGLCDFGTKTNGFHIHQEFIHDSKFNGVLRVRYILNENTNKTCYFIELFKTFNNDNDDNDDIAVFDSSGEKLKTLYSDPQHTVFCLISNKQPEQMDYFTFLGKDYTFL